jgi:hypothetical protein
MRLLHSTSLELREFQNYESISYAILSHTWAEQEVLFQEIDGFNAASMPTQVKKKLGYKKIQACCAQAKRDGFDYVWIDTCCIDKRSSAELSEAINSMYRWYQDCTICYAYLSDVPNNASPEIRNQKFRESRWFTRGWTLQELIGPLNLEFYGDQWYSKGQSASLGTKRSLQDQIYVITRIPQGGLLSSSAKQPDYSIAQKMSWAANRATTRIEDRAYSLMGLFNVNMPLLYGEGDRAFIRLQEEILKVSTDETLFAWKMAIHDPWFLLSHGLLAMSLDYFADSGQIIEKIHIPRKVPSTVTNKGLHLEMTLPRAIYINEARTLRNRLNDLDAAYVSLLNCADENSGKIVGILLSCLGVKGEESEFESELVRIYPHELLFIGPEDNQPSAGDRTTIFAKLSQIYDPKAVNREVQERHLNQERKRRLLVLREAPLEFQIFEARGSKEWTKSVDDLWVANPDMRPRRRKKFLSAELIFDDGVDSFIVAFLWFPSPPGVYIHQCSQIDTELDLIEFLDFEFIGDGKSDRATCILSSERVVSASFRPEHWRGDPCYALRVSVCNPSI